MVKLHEVTDQILDFISEIWKTILDFFESIFH